MKILVVVDMQNDFIDGALGSEDAVSIVEGVAERVASFDGRIIFTRDTHTPDYMNTQEGRKLPVPHCIKDTDGWQISKKISVPKDAVIIDKLTFGSSELGELLVTLNNEERVESVELLGLCTDICVISNAMVAKAFLPEAEISVNAALSRGVSPESHNTALAAMRACQIDIIG